MNKILSADRDVKLLEFLFKALGDTKKIRVKEYLKRRQVSVNGRVTTQFDHLLKSGDQIRIETSRIRARTPSLQFDIEIVHEDDSLIVIHKPAGLLSIATETVRRETAIFAVNDYLNKKAVQGLHEPRFKKRVFIVHRLDRDASGLLLLAKYEDIKFKLQRNWDKNLKEYDAIVEGSPAKASGTITSYLTENKFLRVFSGPRTPETKKAITHYKVIQPGKDYSLLKIRLETGRKHQIRVQLADLGHPIAGDKTYGAKTNPVGRLALHASRLEFKHPKTSVKLSFTLPLPPALKACVKHI